MGQHFTQNIMIQNKVILFLIIWKHLEKHYNVILRKVYFFILCHEYGYLFMYLTKNECLYPSEGVSFFLSCYLFNLTQTNRFILCVNAIYNCIIYCINTVYRTVLLQLSQRNWNIIYPFISEILDGVATVVASVKVDHHPSYLLLPMIATCYWKPKSALTATNTNTNYL